MCPPVFGMWVTKVSVISTTCYALQSQQRQSRGLSARLLRFSLHMEGEASAFNETASPRNRAWFDACVDAAHSDRWSAELKETRLAGLSLLADTALPSAKQEPWRFADLSAIWAATPAERENHDQVCTKTTEIMQRQWCPTSRDEEASVVLMVNGVVTATRNCGFDDEISSSSIYIGPIGNASSEVATRFDLSAIPEAALEAAEPNAALGSTPFAALNAACAEDAVVVAVKGDVHASAFVVHATTTGVAHARLAIAVEDTAQLELHQIFLMLDDETGVQKDAPQTRLCNSRTTINVAKGASLTHNYAILEDPNSVGNNGEVIDAQQSSNHIEATCVSVAGRYAGTVLSTSRSRFCADLSLTAPGALASLDGLGLAASKRDVVDLRTQIRHICADASSRQDVRLVATNGGSLLFKGRICVPTVAQRSDAEQICRAAILSDTATANVMPCLDIVANDVKCAHGATVADLDEGALFFLLARGVRRPLARALLVRGFCDDLLSNLHTLAPGVANALDAKIRSIANAQASGILDSLGGALLLQRRRDSARVVLSLIAANGSKAMAQRSPSFSKTTVTPVSSLAMPIIWD
eukprot:CAMPEP_0118906076 /NCGR_PEP_ID=MMETSP1166-20130328/9818_1 /TAXON_ID=1104430 /ORGANISM="Chrysoreinhardia sp, Strain CCMP3193" /LENGTH=583 /DNA_ID=CAMNT_0006845353 /DNA_START=29 /DNA_END=1781 /DNA_ORIENTATION=+